MKRKDMVTKLATDNHVTRVQAEVVTAAVLEEAKRNNEDGLKTTKTKMREAVKFFTPYSVNSVKNLSAFDSLLG
jgi:hypothetical protein